MIPDSRNIVNKVPPSQTAPANTVSTRSPVARKAILPDDGTSGSSTATHTIIIRSDVPPRPSTAPPHPASDATKGKEQQTDPQTRTALVSNLRAHNLLLQKAISHIDDAVLHLMAARSGIPSSKIQQVRGEAKSRKDLLDMVDKAIEMARNGELKPDGTSEGTSSGAGNERPLTDTKPVHVLNIEALPGTKSPNTTRPPSSVDSVDTLQLRRSSSQPQLSPSTGERQISVKMYTLTELHERRKVLQASIESWQKFVVELRATQPHVEVLPDAVAPSVQAGDPSSWTAKYQRAQFEIKRREDLLLRLNQAVAQVSNPVLPPPTPEQFTALATYIPPALDKARFDVAYAHFCQEKSIQMNTSIVMPDVSKPVIDVYSLHAAVMHEGSFARVSTRKSWDVVGARLGFIQKVGTATEPARSSPEIAAHLEKAYRDRLQQFDHLYVSSVIETVRKRMAEQQKKA